MRIAGGPRPLVTQRCQEKYQKQEDSAWTTSSGINWHKNCKAAASLALSYGYCHGGQMMYMCTCRFKHSFLHETILNPNSNSKSRGYTSHLTCSCASAVRLFSGWGHLSRKRWRTRRRRGPTAAQTTSRPPPRPWRTAWWPRRPLSAAARGRRGTWRGRRGSGRGRFDFKQLFLANQCITVFLTLFSFLQGG